ncbi:hypothetical protein BSKO_11346 [Bryopsis sp. KO-2023]|nr:hypothetical protein BSKO_11346 [Bryopsis sp. KO-2023]
MDLKTASDFLRAKTGEEDLYHALCNNADNLYVQPTQVHPTKITFHELPEELARANDYKEHRLPMGLFPLIDRAWAFVHRGLFIWQPGNTKEKPIELLLNYQEDVRCVEIVRPKENVFSENLMVMCSSRNVSLYKVLLDNGVRQGVFFSSVPFYKCRTGGRSITAVVGTENGRIFLGTECGRLYELWYSTKEGINEGAPKCRLICCSWTFRDCLPSTIIGRARAIIQIVVDEQRGILYASHEDSRIEVFDLGDDLHGRAMKVGECTNLHAEALRASGGQEAAIEQRSKISLASIAPIPRGVSQILHLEGVTADGVRLYFTTWANGKNDVFFGRNVAPRGDHPQRPSALRALFATRIPVVSTDLMAAGGRVPATFDIASTNSTTAFSQSCEKLNSQSEIHLLEPPRNSHRHFRTAYHGVVATIRGTARALAPKLRKAPEAVQWYFDETGDCAPPQSAQFFASQPTFRLLTTTGSMDVEIQWPANLVRNALQGGHRRQLAKLVEMYGGEESAALFVHAGANPPSNSARSEALAALTDASLRKQADASDGVLVVRNNFLGPAQNDFLGPAQIDFADVVAGTKTYVRRWLELIWSWKLFEDVRLQGSVPTTRVAVKKDVIDWYKKQCESTAAFIDEILKTVEVRKKKKSKVPETQKEKLKIELEAIGYLVRRAGHVMSILDIVSKRSLSELPCLINSVDRQKFVSLTFDDVVSDETPDCPLQRLIFDMVVNTEERGPDPENIPAIHVNGTVVESETTEPGNGRNTLMEEFEGKAPSFFGASEREIIAAYELLGGGADEPLFSRDIEVEGAVGSLLQHPAAIILEPICYCLALKEKYEAMSVVCLAAANARDPQNLAFKNENGADCPMSVNAAARRQPCYDKILEGVGALLTDMNDGVQSSEQYMQRKRKLHGVLQTCTEKFDPILFKQLFDYMKRKDRLTELLEVQTSAFTQYLSNLAGMDSAQVHGELGALSEDQHAYAVYLGEHFAHKKDLEKSALLFWRLARRNGNLAIQNRAELFKRAIGIAMELGDATVEDTFRDNLECAEIQIKALHYMMKMGEGTLGVDRLKNDIVDIADLLDVFAKPHKMHDLCIRCLALMCDYPNREEELLIHWKQFTHNAFEAKQRQGIEAQVKHFCKSVANLSGKLRADFDAVGGSWVCRRLEILVFQSVSQIDPSTELHQMSEEHKRLVFETILKACRGSRQICFRAYHGSIDFIVRDTAGSLAFKLDMFRSCLMICQALMPELQGLMEGAEGRDVYEAEIVLNQFIRSIDEFSAAARQVTSGENSLLLDLYDGFDSIRMGLRETINSRKPLFLRDPGFVEV